MPIMMWRQFFITLLYVSWSPDFKETPQHEDIEPRAVLAWNSAGEANHVESYTTNRDFAQYEVQCRHFHRELLSARLTFQGQFELHLSGFSRRIVSVHSLQSDTPDLGDSSHSIVHFTQVPGCPSATPTIRSLRKEDGYSGKLTYWMESLTLAHPQLWRCDYRA
ncbi:hypothetical protein ARMGADRAFT_1062260 [Armillaria gallica]|uniref:Uncharacterized protein n=1 Tax=Armillaria gallica TaxID=47427 RepID=A0A2H3DHD1_ARMGA|nr:hypothetical protein ARMGADRAFT_1062260 [Armillaria gallica]